MEQADFVHLARLSEQASARDGKAYRRSVAAFVALGYGWVLGCLLVAGAVLAWIAWEVSQGRWFGFMLTGLLAAGALFWSSARALWCRIDPPAGLVLRPADAPGLFEALERIRRKVQGPPLDEVQLDGEFNACILQRPRHGLFGGSHNTLVIGLPLLLALDRQRVLAILAHEYGHLRGGHGRFAAWIYRTRSSWSRLHDSLQEDGGLAAWLTQGFLRWYFPRFVARTFALARQDEYEADRIAARLLGAQVAGAALVEVALKSAWLAERLWPEHWAQAAGAPLPVGPFSAWRQALLQPLPPGFARPALRQALRQTSGLDDTHPVLRDRLEALDVAPRLPDWSRKGALALLAQPERWIERLDRQWCRDQADGWKRHHASLSRQRARAEALAARPGKTADELVLLAQLAGQLDPRAPVQAHYQAALAQSPGHAGALAGLYQCLPEDAPQGERLALLAQVHEAGADLRWWAAQAAVAALEDDPGHDAATLRSWRERLRAAEALEQQAREELLQEPLLQRTFAADLDAFEREELQQALAEWKPVYRAWLLRKQILAIPQRRCYLLAVDMAGLEPAQAWGCCRALEQALPLPGPVLVVAIDQAPELLAVERGPTPPVYPVAAAG